MLVPPTDSLCGGLDLRVGKLYLIAGNSQKINICNYVKEYSQMTIVERRGFAGGYKKGCLCEVSEFERCVFNSRHLSSSLETFFVTKTISVSFNGNFSRSSQCSKWLTSINRLERVIGNHFPNVKPISGLVFPLVDISVAVSHSSAIGAPAYHTIHAFPRKHERKYENRNSFKHNLIQHLVN